MRISGLGCLGAAEYAPRIANPSGIVPKKTRTPQIYGVRQRVIKDYSVLNLNGAALTQDNGVALMPGEVPSVQHGYALIHDDIG